MENTQKLYFYSSKVKNVLLLIVGLVFIAFGVLVCGAAFNERDFLISGVGAFIALFFGLLTFGILKKMLSPKPYLILTEEELIINASSKKAIPIKWDDIEGYNIQNVHFSKFIEIMLHDEEKYRARMSNTTRKLNKLNDVMNFSPFAIAWVQVKRKDRDKLVNELDRLNRCASEFNDQLYVQMNVDDKGQKSYRQVNGKYMLKSYGLSLILTGVSFLFFYWANADDYIPFLFVSFIMYPFAKIIYDVLLGFKFDYKMAKQSFISVYFYQLRFAIHVLIYYLSFYIAPLGIFYIILRTTYRLIKKGN
ncbi:STM3941 family protein [Virgibacillus necropolis]|uniref:Uncharacterized protein n=1 Tax=Virgibacillus necropolis TaxID=163877 RepID=A0A221MEK2_9BACI|nr:STM3941 family protein [Virgibacillus necropolis]ASN06077.1 hypothetical protein CFK40_14140 [Virgibacillus necropolis]